MNMQVESAQSPVVTEFGEQVPTAAEQPLVVDKALVALLVGQAR